MYKSRSQLELKPRDMTSFKKVVNTTLEGMSIIHLPFMPLNGSRLLWRQQDNLYMLCRQYQRLTKSRNLLQIPQSNHFLVQTRLPWRDTSHQLSFHLRDGKTETIHHWWREEKCQDQIQPSFQYANNQTNRLQTLFDSVLVINWTQGWRLL